MGEYVYKESKSEMKELNLATANRELQKLNREVQSLARRLNFVSADVEAVNNGWVPSERYEPSTIHGQLPSRWFFDSVNIGNCHDCPLQSVEHQSDRQCRCGAEQCVVRQLCELEGTARRIS